MTAREPAMAVDESIIEAKPSAEASEQEVEIQDG